MKHFNKISFIMIAVLCVTLLACITAFVILCAAGVDPQIYSSDTISSSEALLPETYDYGSGYIKSIVFVGDRTISPLAHASGQISQRQVWSGEDGTMRLDRNLAEMPITYADGTYFSSVSLAASNYKPMYMVITVGLDNGVGYCTKEKFKEYYSSLVESVKEISPDTKIMLQSVFPVSKAVEKDDPAIKNSRIDEVNDWICELCSEMSLGYLDTHSALSDKKGYLKSEYDSGDGITLNNSGYDQMLTYIRTHGYQ